MQDKTESHDEDLEWEEWDPSKGTFITHMIAGSFAGLAEHVSMFPMDTIKTHLQCERCGSMNPSKTLQCAKGIVDKEGLLRLWRGVTATFAGCIPAHAAYFSIFETMKRFTGADGNGHFPLEAALCGAGATLAHDLFMTPFDTVKQRMQLGYYESVIHCTSSVIKTEGLRALYISLPATLLMNIPYGMIMVATNESCKTMLNPRGDYSFVSSMVSGSIAGGVAAALTTPLDIVKTRLQTNNLVPTMPFTSSGGLGGITRTRRIVPEFSNTLSSGQARHTHFQSSGGVRMGEAAAWALQSMKTTTMNIFQECGVKGYFRGVVPRVLTHSPAVAISWTAYETGKNALNATGWTFLKY
jgi:solute carrier family 25 (mitochondrial iron transporter), member 28/37